MLESQILSFMPTPSYSPPSPHRPRLPLRFPSPPFPFPKKREAEGVERAVGERREGQEWAWWHNLRSLP